MTTPNFLDQLPPKIKAIAQHVKLNTPEQILSTPKTIILDKCDAVDKIQDLDKVVSTCTADDVRILKEAAAKLVAQHTDSVYNLVYSPTVTMWSHITFGCQALDRCTGGGICTRGITELCGSSAVGKTQLLLQLSLCVQLPLKFGGLNKGVVYICTQENFPSKRLLQISKAFAERYPLESINFLGNIYIEHLYESEDLLKCVSERIQDLMRKVSIGLIIIDSVAAIFRLYTNFVARARDMRKMVNALLAYTDKYQCAVVCVNQVTAKMDHIGAVPCLGLAWAHLGRTRMYISKVPKQLKIENQLTSVRKLEVVYSPETPNEFAEFIITSQGVQDVPEQQ